MKQSKSFYKNLMAVLLTLAFGMLALVFGVLFLGCGNEAPKTGSAKRPKRAPGSRRSVISPSRKQMPLISGR